MSPRWEDPNTVAGFVASPPNEQLLAFAREGRKSGAGLFLFTFSRHTLPDDATPDPGESFVFSSWNSEPQCFLTEAEIIEELARAGFVRDSDAPLTEYNRPRAGTIRVGGPPVIYEGTFTRDMRE